MLNHPPSLVAGAEWPIGPAGQEHDRHAELSRGNDHLGPFPYWFNRMPVTRTEPFKIGDIAHAGWPLRRLNARPYSPRPMPLGNGPGQPETTRLRNSSSSRVNRNQVRAWLSLPCERLWLIMALLVTTGERQAHGLGRSPPDGDRPRLPLARDDPTDAPVRGLTIANPIRGRSSRSRRHGSLRPAARRRWASSAT
jgi:hypothetical protein